MKKTTLWTEEEMRINNTMAIEKYGKKWDEISNEQREEILDTPVALTIKKIRERK
jgi:hypothetical protein